MHSSHRCLSWCHACNPILMCETVHHAYWDIVCYRTLISVHVSHLLWGVEPCRRRILMTSNLPGVSQEGSEEERLIQISSLLPLDCTNLVTELLCSTVVRINPHTWPSPVRMCTHNVTYLIIQHPCMHPTIHTHLHASKYTHTLTLTHTHSHTHMHTCTHTLTCTHTHTLMHTYMRTHTHTLFHLSQVRSLGVLLKYVDKKRLGVELEDSGTRVPILAIQTFSL